VQPEKLQGKRDNQMIIRLRLDGLAAPHGIAIIILHRAMLRVRTVCVQKEGY
jgi:hypothetical protein